MESTVGITGSPFLYKEFKNGLLYLDNKAPLNIMVRYNVSKEEMQVFFGEKKYYILKDRIEVRIESDLFKKFGYEVKHQMPMFGYFRIITPNSEKEKLVLMQKHLKSIRGGQAAGAMKMPTSPKYLDKSDYYLKFSDADFAVLAEKRVKKFVRVFPRQHQEKILSYIHEKNLKPKKEEDLSSIVDYYNRNF